MPLDFRLSYHPYLWTDLKISFNSTIGRTSVTFSCTNKISSDTKLNRTKVKIRFDFSSLFNFSNRNAHKYAMYFSQTNKFRPNLKSAVLEFPRAAKLFRRLTTPDRHTISSGDNRKKETFPALFIPVHRRMPRNVTCLGTLNWRLKDGMSPFVVDYEIDDETNGRAELRRVQASHPTHVSSGVRSKETENKQDLLWRSIYGNCTAKEEIKCALLNKHSGKNECNVFETKAVIFFSKYIRLVRKGERRWQKSLEISSGPSVVLFGPSEIPFLW